MGVIVKFFIAGDSEIDEFETINDDLSGCRYVCITGRRFRRRRRRTQIIYCFKKISLRSSA